MFNHYFTNAERQMFYRAAWAGHDEEQDHFEMYCAGAEL